jgi:hypothetical protein
MASVTGAHLQPRVHFHEEEIHRPVKPLLHDNSTVPAPHSSPLPRCRHRCRSICWRMAGHAGRGPSSTFWRTLARAVTLEQCHFSRCWLSPNLISMWRGRCAYLSTSTAHRCY